MLAGAQQAVAGKPQPNAPKAIILEVSTKYCIQIVQTFLF